MNCFNHPQEPAVATCSDCGDVYKRQLLTLIIPIRVYTQQIESERDKIFEHVDLQQVPYGILEDYGLSSVSLLPYTKQELDTTNYLNYLEPVNRVA